MSPALAQYLKYKFEYRIYALAGVNIEFNYSTTLNSEFTPADAYIYDTQIYILSSRGNAGDKIYITIF